MLVLLGTQLIIFWLLMRVLDEVSQRDAMTTKDMIGNLTNGKTNR